MKENASSFFWFLTGSCGNIRFKNYNLFSDYAEYFWKVAKVEFMKMSTLQENAQCVSWFKETKSVIQAQQNFIRKYGRKPPARSTIRAWHEKFMETGSMLQRKGASRPQISEEEIESVQVAYTRSSRKSIRRASTQLQIPRSTILKVLHRNLRLYAYKEHLLQALKPEDKPQQKEFAVTMPDRLDLDQGFWQVFVSVTSQRFTFLD